jgi:hypothetical protein
MATTKYKIAEQAQRIYARFLDKDNPSDVIDLREVKLLVEQSINKVLKLQVAESFKAGNVDVPKCSIIQYTRTVTSDSTNSRSYIILPAVPLSLPMDLGIWSISATNATATPYIPIPAQDVLVFGTIASGTNVSYLEGQVGYYLQGTKVYFTKDITLSANGSITSVLVNLLVSDFSQLTDTDLLPISPDVETAIINEVLTVISNGRVAQAELGGQQQQ